MKAFDLIARYFVTPRTPPSPDGIAKGPAILDAARSLLTLALLLKVYSLPAEQRQALSGKGGPGQRRRSEAFQEFLARRQDFAARVSVDPAIFLTVIEKDESFDILLATLVLVRQCLDDGQLQLAAWLSEKLDTVLSYVKKIWAPDAPAELLSQRVNFTAVNVAQGEQEVQKKEQQDRVGRKQEAAQRKLDQAEADKTLLGQIDRLTRDAQAGVGPVAPVPVDPPPQHGHKTAGHRAPAPRTNKKNQGGA